MARLAGVAQLAERYLAKVEVAGSTPVARSVPLRLRPLGRLGGLCSTAL
jgi:hypothetical protein